MFAYYSEGSFQSAPSQEKCDPRLAQSIGRDVMVAMCDGSVRMLSATIRPTTWYYLCDPSDGNVIPGDDLD
jgi:prepilin-type processing-associated H-X9-DG protein